MSTNPWLKAGEPDRRRFMSTAARTFLGVHLLPVFGPALAAAPVTNPKAKAKHVIYLFMAGGMSHLDTFDPKPKKKDVMGKTETIATKADGVQLGHYLKKTAEVADKLCVINSMNSTQGAHEQGSYTMHTSYGMRGTVRHPSGFFGAKYGAAPVGSPEEGLRDCSRAPAVSPEDFERRLSLADKLNRQFHDRYPNADVKAYEELYREAVSLMNSKDLKAFDLRRENEATRALYGPGRFAQGCMLARRLVEHGVRFVEVQLGGWDTHYDNFTGVEGRCREFDQAYAALITDLQARGKLDETLVVVATEFGRTPEIKAEHQGGRDHHPSAFSCVLAGGGVKGGIKHGLTDASGNKVRSGIVTVQDFNATIVHALGINHEEVLMSPTRRPFTIADKGKPVTAVFA